MPNKDMLLKRLLEIGAAHFSLTKEQRTALETTIHSSLGKLNPREKEFIKLWCALEGGYAHTLKEIAIKLKTTEGGVQHLKDTAIQNLEKLLRKE